MADYSAHFHEEFILKKQQHLFKKQNSVCAHKFSWFTKKVICTTCVVLQFFGSPVKLRECTNDNIAPTR